MTTRSLGTNGLKFAYVSIMCAVALTWTPLVRAAASPQVCTVAQTCSIGEFLYDDSYVPITSGTCTFTSRNPDGTMYINAVPLSSTADGWYAHEFTTPSTEGIYRSQICCTAGSDYLCIDKSFEAREASNLSANDVSNAVWNSPKSSHTTAGTFGSALQNATETSSEVASAVWGYSGRTLNSFSSLVDDIWSGTTRTLTSSRLSSGHLAKKEDIKDTETKTYNTYNNTYTTNDSATATLKDIRKDTKETRILLEKQVNKPVVTKTIQDTSKLQSKLKTTQDKAQDIYFVVAQTQTALKGLQKSWLLLSRADRLEKVNQLLAVVGEPTDKMSQETLFGTTTWFVKQWDFAFGKTASKNVTQLYKDLKFTQRQLASGDKKVVYFPINTLNTAVLLKLNIGEIGDDSTNVSLFSEIHDTVQFVADLENHSQELDNTLNKWKKMPKLAKMNVLLSLNRDILALNRIPQVNSIVKPLRAGVTDKEMHNKVLFLSGLVQANKEYLANNPQKSFASSWLELGSIVFKTLVTNPSTLLTQDADVTYYLPKEVQKKDIIKIDKGLTLKLDSEKGQYYVEGTFTLDPGESKIVSVRVTDIWLVSDKEVKSLKAKAAALVEPLKKTSYFGQGVTLKADIDVALDKIMLRQQSTETPEAKLVAYREAQVELKDIKGRMNNLQDLVSEAGSTGTFFGFVGATQTLAVWGLIIIISAGFIFLTIYMRKLSEMPLRRVEEAPAAAPVKPVVKAAKKSKVVDAEPVHINHKLRPSALVIAFVLVYGTSVASAASYITYSVQDQKTPSSQEKVLGMSSKETQDFCAAQAQSAQAQSAQAPAIEPEKLEKPVKAKVYATITETPTGWLRVRQTPSGSEVAKVDVGKSFLLVEKTDAWMKIKLEDETTGWVSSRYVTVAPQEELQ